METDKALNSLEDPAPITEHNWDEGIKPVVSICTITFNHEKYIRDAIEGFLMQETTFPVEIIIHDDASTDSTANIIREYKEEYPDLFRIIIQDENQWSKGGGSIYARFVFPEARGKYIAMCEGDDYWTDTLKLQKQVELLEKNQDYTLTVGGFKKKNDETNKLEDIIRVVNRKDHKDGYTFKLSDTTKGWITKTLTSVFRANAVRDLNYSIFNHFRDVHLNYHLLSKGKGFYFTEVLGVYRVHTGGIFSMKQNGKRCLEQYYIFKEIYNEYSDNISRIFFLSGIKSLISEWPSSYTKKIGYLNLLKQGFSLTTNLKETFSLTKSAIPFLVKICKLPRKLAKRLRDYFGQV